MKQAIVAVYRLRGPVWAVAAAALIAVALSSGLTLGDEIRAVRTIVALVALCVFVVCVALVFLGPKLLPSRPVQVVASPVDGRWLGMNSPETKVPSHGIRMYGQAYAIDLVFEPDDTPRPAFGRGPAWRLPQEYPAFGEPVFAMIDGTVVRASDRLRDHRARSGWLSVVYMMIEAAVRELGGPGFILGNHVTIRGADGEFATVAHLQQGSVAVRVGEVVRAGQQIGCCGNSGNSSEPHVHAQLMDRVSLWTAQGLPMAFAGITVGDDPTPRDALPSDGEHATVHGPR